MQDDESWQLNRLAEAIVLAADLGCAGVFCDTFSDNDRGYFPRSGIVDRRYNPKKGMHLIQNLRALMCLSCQEQNNFVRSSGGLLQYEFSSRERKQRLCIVDASAIDEKTACSELIDEGVNWHCVDLIDQRIFPLKEQKSGDCFSIMSGRPFALIELP